MWTTTACAPPLLTFHHAQQQVFIATATPLLQALRITSTLTSQAATKSGENFALLSLEFGNVYEDGLDFFWNIVFKDFCAFISVVECGYPRSPKKIRVRVSFVQGYWHKQAEVMERQK